MISMWFRDLIITLRLRLSQKKKKIGFILTQYFVILFIAIFYMHTALINNWSYLLSIFTTNLLNILDYLMDSRNVTLQIDWIIICCYLLSFGYFFVFAFVFITSSMCGTCVQWRRKVKIKCENVVNMLNG